MAIRDMKGGSPSGFVYRCTRGNGCNYAASCRYRVRYAGDVSNKIVW
jgi:hypothetical protein